MYVYIDFELVLVWGLFLFLAVMRGKERRMQKQVL